MKRVLALILALLLTLPLLPLVCAAEEENLLFNGDFEYGTANWEIGDTYELVDGAHGGTKALKITKGDNAWFSTQQNPYAAMKKRGDGLYRASCWVKGSAGVGQLAIKLIDPKGNATYALSAKVNLSGTWQRIECTFSFRQDEVSRITYYFYNGTSDHVTMTVDDCELCYLAEPGVVEDITMPVKRPEKTRIGAIRWDAYFATSEKVTMHTPADQVARTLSYYPEQAPYYTRERQPASGDVKFAFESVYQTQGVTYTMDNVKKEDLAPITIKYDYGVSWEEEAILAMDAGIDYFAYVWYSDLDPMALPRKAHVATNGMLPDGRQMQMAMVLQHGQFGRPVKLENRETDEDKARAIPTDHKQCYQAMAMSSYLTVESQEGKRIPMLFCYEAGAWTSEELEACREECVFYTAYLEKKNPEKYTHVDDVYFIAMTGTVNEASAATFSFTGFDAVSRYGTSHTVKGEASETMDRLEYNDFDAEKPKHVTVLSDPYEKLLEAEKNLRASYQKANGYISAVPGMSMGHNCRPRIRTGVSWTGDYGLKYMQTGTAEQIAQNMTDLLNFTKEDPKTTKTNAVIVYAWNEHDEGGYLCPTVAVDENGQPIKNADGTFKKNSAVLDAVAKAIADYRAHEADAPVPTEAVTEAPSGTPTPAGENVTAAPTEKPDVESKAFSPWWIILPAAAVAAAGTVIAVLVIRKKKKEE